MTNVQDVAKDQLVRLAILQPTSSCNLNCTYCYVPDRKNSLIMSDAIVRKAAAFVFDAIPRHQSSITFLWHAGEPLMAGINFYQRAFAIIDELRASHLHVRHSFQTNGTLVSKDWLEFFSDHDVSIGISLDGPRFLHDANRINWGGRGSYDRAMHGLALLQNYQYDPAAICVLTPTSLGHPDEIYDFFTKHDVPSVGFNVEESEGTHRRSRLLDAGPWATRRAYVRFMRQIWNRWREKDRSLRVREIERELAMIQDLKEDSNFVATPDEVLPFANITIRRDGAISTFAPELASTVSPAYNDFIIGNVLTDVPGDVLASSALQQLHSAVLEGREACRSSCAYFQLCGGGYQSNRMAEHGSLKATATSTCRIHRMALTDVVVSELRKLSDHQQ